jgi:hypothetical protein
VPFEGWRQALRLAPAPQFFYLKNGYSDSIGRAG